MLYISNRGNLAGRDPKEENSIQSLQHAISSGYCVKTDLWSINGRLATGNDHPLHGIKLENFDKGKMLIRARNLPALLFLLENAYHCYWRESDDVVLTNKNFVLSFNNSLIPKSIVMNPEDNVVNWNNYSGLCSDFISGYTQ
tara:strand:+ start:7497 stop:7922 length:426 start_codon:yes stop_codon:yes gene_type:complete